MKGNITNQIFNWSTEDLRKELCLIEYDEMKLRVSQIKDKFQEINEMLDKQIKVHKHWDKLNQVGVKEE